MGLGLKAFSTSSWLTLQVGDLARWIFPLSGRMLHKKSTILSAWQAAPGTNRESILPLSGNGA